MKTKWSFFVVIILLASLGAAAQTKSLTNADLEKYKHDRLKAEQDYRENYERWGMPSPEELDRRAEKSQKDLKELAAKLREEEIQRSVLQAQAGGYQTPLQTYNYWGSSGYYPYWNGEIWSASWLRPRFRRGHVTHYGLNGYVGGGNFWPAPGSGAGRYSSGYVGGGNFWPGPRASSSPISHGGFGGGRR